MPGTDASVEARIAAVAHRQYGNVTRRQLLDAGLGNKAIVYRLRMKRLHRVHPGVYAVGKPARTALERAMAAVLACGLSAALSDAASAALWGFRKGWPAVIEVTTPCDRRPKGVKVHRSRTLTHRDITTQLGIRTTTPARTMLDVAPTLEARALTRMVNDALHSPFLTRAQLADVCARHPTHRGTKLIKPFYETTDGPSRSDWEDDFRFWCELHHLPRPRINQDLHGREVDAYFPAERLIVELDSWEFHNDRRAFEADRDRDAQHLAVDIATVRITWDRQHGGGDREAERLGRILALRRERLSRG